MSDIKVNNIRSLNGANGPEISGTVEMNSTGAMSLPRGDTAYRGGRGTGIFAGGRTSPGLKERMDKFTISTLGNGIDFGNLTTTTAEFGGCASSTRGIFMGGETFPTNINTIQYLTISQLGNTFDFGDLTKQKRATSCLSDNTRGICVGGSAAPRCSGIVNGVDGHLEAAVAEVDDVPGEVVCVTWFPGYNGFLQGIIHLHRRDDRRIRIQFV